MRSEAVGSCPAWSVALNFAGEVCSVVRTATAFINATQEILVRIITHLSQFDFRSKLKTWAYRIAVNYILDVKKSRVERLNLSFEKFAEGLTSELSLSAPSERGSFASAPSSFQETRAKVRQVEEARWALEVHRTSHPRASPVDFARRLVETLDLD